ncbi:MAG: hypothetical protein OEZ07_02855 [Dehalococcoidia bacterium]|nr:hypothetical protein [Dehalococcoidia bacterium]MDH5781492.1 hypothetical protein [Dehalococcoidia bacterium]
MKNFWARGSIYFAEHVNFSAIAHLFAGLGIAWLVSLYWHYALPPLVAGGILVVASIAMHVHAIRMAEFL